MTSSVPDDPNRYVVMDVGLAGEHSPWCGNTSGPRFSITGALPPAGQPEER